MSARLHTALPRDSKFKLGSFVAPSGSRTQSEGETLEFLLSTHFPNTVVTQESATPAAALLARRPNWRHDWFIDSASRSW